MKTLMEIGKNAKEASRYTARLSTGEKNIVLNCSADAMVKDMNTILAENQKDITAAKKNGIKGALIDRLTLTEERILSIADGLKAVAALEDPVGEALFTKTLPNGLIVSQKRVPIGVVAIIYEARPNVTADAFALVLKAGSSVILRGGKEAVHSNMAMVQIFQTVLEQLGHNPDMVQLIEDTSRESATELMRMNGYVDILIPRGGAGLIQSVVKNATVPVIETGVGNCHIFVDEYADLEKAGLIIINAKTQRPGVCNACEKLLLHKNIAKEYLPRIYKELIAHGVEVRGDGEAEKIEGQIKLMEEKEWFEEYLDYIIGVKIVGSIDEAIQHIHQYSSGHSEAIITENYTNAQKFMREVDSAAVYVNASTRFTDGFEMGFGAEIGISTQKLHARGPMGLKELTTTKFLIYGEGHIRE